MFPIYLMANQKKLLLKKKRKKKDQKIFDEAAAGENETAVSLVARVFDATSNFRHCYRSLASVFVDIGSTLADQKEAIFAALEGLEDPAEVLGARVLLVRRLARAARGPALGPPRR